VLLSANGVKTPTKIPKTLKIHKNNKTTTQELLPNHQIPVTNKLPTNTKNVLSHPHPSLLFLKKIKEKKSDTLRSFGKDSPYRFLQRTTRKKRYTGLSASLTTLSHRPYGLLQEKPNKRKNLFA